MAKASLVHRQRWSGRLRLPLAAAAAVGVLASLSALTVGPIVASGTRLRDEVQGAEASISNEGHAVKAKPRGRRGWLKKWFLWFAATARLGHLDEAVVAEDATAQRGPDESHVSTGLAAFELDPLGDMSSLQDVAYLCRLLRSEDATVRSLASELLAELGPSAWSGGAAEMREALSDGNVHVRRAAMVALVSLDAEAVPEDVSTLLGLLDDEDYFLRWKAAEVLAILTPLSWPGGPAEMREALKSQAVSDRRGAVVALGYLFEAMGPEDAAALRGALKDEDEEIRNAASTLLKQAGLTAWPGGAAEMREALEDGDVPTRLAAASAFRFLGENAAPEDVAALRQALKDPDERVGDSATNALIDLGIAAWPGGRAEIHEAIKSPDISMRGLAVYALGSLREKAGPEDLAALREAVKDRDMAVFWSAIEMLSAWGDQAWPDISDDMRELLHSTDRNTQRAASAILAFLGESAEPRAMEEIRKAFAEQDLDLNWKVAKALGKSSELREAAWPGGAAEMREAVKSEDRYECLAAMAALGYLGDAAGPDDVAALSDIFGRDDDGMPEQAAVMLARIGEAGAVVLREATKDDNSTIRKRAMRALGKLGEQAKAADVAALREALEDQTLGLTALQVLHGMGSAAWPGGPEEMRTKAKDESSTMMRRAALLALGHLGDEVGPADAAALKEALEDADEFNAQIAGEILQNLGGAAWPRGAAEMREALSSGSPLLKRAGMSALSAHLSDASEQDIAALREALDDDDFDLSRAAAQMLSRFGDVAWPGGAAEMRKALKDESNSTRFSAVFALGGLEVVTRAEDEAALAEALKDKEARVRWAAAVELGLSISVEGSDVAIGALQEAVHDEDDLVRRAAVKSLRSLDGHADRGPRDAKEEEEGEGAEEA